jgi:hypothetical protein
VPTPKEQQLRSNKPVKTTYFHHEISNNNILKKLKSSLGIANYSIITILKISYELKFTPTSQKKFPVQPNFPHRHSKAAIFTSSLNRSHRTFPVHYNLKNLKERSNSSISKNSSSFISKTSPKQGTHHVITKKKKKPHGYKATGENLQLITNLLQMRLHGRRELVEIPQRRITPTR